MTRVKTRHQTGERIDGAAVGLLLAFAVVIGLFVLWFYPLAQARHGANPGLTAYKPPPATVIPDMPTRVVTRHPQARPPVEIRSRPEQPRTTASAPANYASAVSDYADGARRSVADTSERFVEQAQNTIDGVVQSQPLAVAFVGLAAGAAVAAIFSPTNIERRTLGPAGERLYDVTSATKSAMNGYRTGAVHRTLPR